MEATLSPVRSPKQLKVVTLVLALAAPVVSSAGLVIRMVDVIVGSIVRIDRYICRACNLQLCSLF